MNAFWETALRLLTILPVDRDRDTGSTEMTQGLCMPTSTSATGIHVLSDETTRQVSTYDRATRRKTRPVPRGRRTVLVEATGAGAIQALWLTFPGWFWQHWDSDKPVSQLLLKLLVLRIYWDDAETPAVESPIADFFGDGLCRAPSFAGVYFGMSSGGFYCRFPMPFRESFRIEVENLHPDIDTEVYANVLYQQHDDVAPEAGYFHARYRTGVSDGSVPLVVDEVRGRGHWCGMTLSMQCRARNTLAFLEAPEFVHVDDDWEEPRFTGTGMEDYFLGGWYFREGECAGPLHGVVVKDAFDSAVAMYRVHGRDAVRFRQRFRVSFVHPWEPSPDRPSVWSATSFVYLDTPRGSAAALPCSEDLACWYRVKDCDHASVP